MLKKNYAIIGVGAVGGYYGAQLQKIGCNVHYLFHTAQAYQQALQHGLHVQSKTSAFSLPIINAYKRIEDMPRCEVIIVALKTTQNEHLSDMLPHLVCENTIILVMQNGLGNEEEIASLIEKHSILCAITTIGAAKNQSGIINVSHDGMVKLAAYNPSCDIENVAAIFKLAGVQVELASDHLLIRWQKLLWNIPFNGLSVLHNMTADKLVKECASLVNALTSEIISIAQAYDRVISLEYVEQLMSATRAMTDYKPSMLIDYERKKPLEIEYLTLRSPC